MQPDTDVIILRGSMEIIVVPVPKAKLDRIPEIERAFYIHAGHLRNEIWVLVKILGWSFNDKSDNPVLANVNLAQSLIIERLLAGKLHEGWELFRRAYIDTNLKLSIGSRLSGGARAAFNELDSYFGKSKNTINKVRNRFAFHYDPHRIKEQLSSVEETDKLEIYAGETTANMFYLISETIANSAMLNTIQSGDYEAAAGKLAKEITSIALHFITFCDGCLKYMRESYLGNTPEELNVETVAIPDPPSHKDILFPFFLSK